MADSPNRRAGIIFVKVNGEQLEAKGNFTYNLGLPKRDALVGADGVHGFKEMPKTAFLEGEITDRREFDLAKFQSIDGATVTLELNNGKVVVFRDAWYAADGDAQTEEANVQLRFEAKSAEEVRS